MTANDRPVDGIEILRRRRGTERLSFDELADHLEDLLAMMPAYAATIDRIAHFLAHAEEVGHRHERDASFGSSLAGPEGDRVSSEGSGGGADAPAALEEVEHGRLEHVLQREVGP